MLPLPVLSGSGRTRQERLRRRLRRSSTLDRTCPKVPEFAAIGSRDKSGQDQPRQSVLLVGRHSHLFLYIPLQSVSSNCLSPDVQVEKRESRLIRQIPPKLKDPRQLRLGPATWGAQQVDPLSTITQIGLSM